MGLTIEWHCEHGKLGYFNRKFTMLKEFPLIVMANREEFL